MTTSTESDVRSYIARVQGNDPYTTEIDLAKATISTKVKGFLFDSKKVDGEATKVAQLSLIRALATNTKVTKLTAKKISDDVLDELLSSLKANNSVKVLILYDVILGVSLIADAGASLAGRVAKVEPLASQLVREGSTGIGGQLAAGAASAAANAALKWKDEIEGDKEVPKLLELFPLISGRNLITSLDISYCGLRNRHFRKLFAALSANSSVETLTADKNWLDSVDESNLAEFLSGNRTLLTLSIKNNELEPTEVDKIAEIFPKNKTLKFLYIGGNSYKIEDEMFSCVKDYNSTVTINTTDKVALRVHSGDRAITLAEC